MSEESRIDIRDTKRILLGLGNAKVAYDGTIEQVRDYYSTVKGATRDKNGFFAGKKDTDVFIYAMCLGKKLGETMPFEKDPITGKTDRRATIDIKYFADQPEYVWLMIATALEDTKDPETGNPTMEIFENPKKIIEICEQYANAGIHELLRMADDVSGADPFKGFDRKLTGLLENES